KPFLASRRKPSAACGVKRSWAGSTLCGTFSTSVPSLSTKIALPDAGGAGRATSPPETMVMRVTLPPPPRRTVALAWCVGANTMPGVGDGKPASRSSGLASGVEMGAGMPHVAAMRRAGRAVGVAVAFAPHLGAVRGETGAGEHAEHHA